MKDKHGDDIALDESVIKELKADPILYVLWRCGRGMDTVDHEFDPTHNPDWVSRRKQEETNLLLSLMADKEEKLKEWADNK